MTPKNWQETVPVCGETSACRGDNILLARQSVQKAGRKRTTIPFSALREPSSAIFLKACISSPIFPGSSASQQAKAVPAVQPDCGVTTFSAVYHPAYFLSRWRKTDDNIGNLSSNLDSTIWGNCVVLGKSLTPL